MVIKLGIYPKPKIGEECIFAFWYYDVIHSEGIVKTGILERIEAKKHEPIAKWDKQHEDVKYFKKNDEHKYSYDICIPLRFAKNKICPKGLEMVIDEPYPIDIDKLKKLIIDNLEKIKYVR